MGERNRRDFGLEGCLVGVILEERKWWAQLFFPWAHHFSTPQIGEKMGRRSGWM